MITSHHAIEIFCSLLFSLKKDEVDVGALTLVSSDTVTSRVVFCYVTCSDLFHQPGIRVRAHRVGSSPEFLLLVEQHHAKYLLCTCTTELHNKFIQEELQLNF